VVALLIVVVVAVAIAVVTFEVMSEVRKPATKTSNSRRHRRQRSERRVFAGVAAAASTARRSVALTKGGRTVVETGRHVGQTLADLARSSIAIAPEAPPRAPAQPEVESEVRGDGRVVPLTAGMGENLAAPIHSEPPPEMPSPPAPPAPSPAPGPRRGQAVPSWHHAEVREAAEPPPMAERPMIYTRQVESPRASVPGKRPRVYPPWWRRVFSLITLAVLLGALGLATGTALGAFLAFLYRVVQRAV
jgi:hypothetical protein